MVSHSPYLSSENVSLKVTNVKLVSMNREHQRITFCKVINLSNRNITMAEDKIIKQGTFILSHFQVR